MFDISDKGGIGETRNINLDINTLKDQLLVHKNDLIDIQNNQLSYDSNSIS
jgi:hypothetical protein